MVKEHEPAGPLDEGIDDDEQDVYEEDSYDEEEQSLNSSSDCSDHCSSSEQADEDEASHRTEDTECCSWSEQRDQSETSTEPRFQLRRSSLKSVEEESPVLVSRKSWKSLPVPDMDSIRRERSISNESYFHAPPPRRRRTVSFSMVTIREYDLTLGDNPSVSYGPPISLDWNYEEHADLDLDDYECERGPRRPMRKMLMNYYQRKNLLMHTYGFEEEDLKRAQKESNKVARQRAVTKTFLQFQKVEDLVQSAGRKAKRGFKRQNSKPKLTRSQTI